ncbi:MAG: TonB-dependent receptor [Bryobacteraceae bacterium]|jgi:outer membrane receptor for ferrienterochelin and colicins
MGNCLRFLHLLMALGAGWAAFAQDPPPATPPTTEKALFEDMPVVEAAALHAQSLEEAPASVTVITADDIRKYGYRTLGEALAGVRGLYVTSDHIYQYVGVAGFNIPGDYNTRFLVMLNGHPLTENIFNSNGFFGQDFGLDMDLVARIEVIRGPSSALYGSNGILANINIVTKSPVDMQHLRVSTETGSFGEKKVEVSTALYLGKGANLLFSGSVFNDSGQNFYIPQFDSPSMNYGRAIGVDGERGYHTFANLVWRDWSITAYFNSREQHPPVSWGATIFPDPNSRVRDSRNFVAAAYTREVRADSQLRWQLYYDNYRYDDRFDYPQATGGELAGNALDDIRTRDRGDWIGSELTYRVPVTGSSVLTMGAQINFELRNLQQGFEAAPNDILFARISRPDRSGALFAQEEWSIAPRWKLSAGLRYDESANFGHFISPRLALVYQPSSLTVYKFIYGRAYRNPSTAERYYDDGGYSSIANPSLRQETAQTFEVSAERKLRHDITALIDLYHYRISNMITAVAISPGVQQYQNVNQDHSNGVEFELRGKVWRDLEAAGSFSFDVAGAAGVPGPFPNSPHQIGKLRLSKPFWNGKLNVSSSSQYMGRRATLSDAILGPVWLEDITLGTQRLHPDFDLEFGIRNAFNRQYEDPVYLVIDQIRQDGRSLFVKLIWRTRE